MKPNLYLIKYLKFGVEREMQIPATTEMNAIIRLGQIYGDNYERDEEIRIEFVSITKC